MRRFALVLSLLLLAGTVVAGRSAAQSKPDPLAPDRSALVADPGGGRGPGSGVPVPGRVPDVLAPSRSQGPSVADAPRFNELLAKSPGLAVAPMLGRFDVSTDLLVGSDGRIVPGSPLRVSKSDGLLHAAGKRVVDPGNGVGPSVEVPGKPVTPPGLAERVKVVGLSSNDAAKVGFDVVGFTIADASAKALGGVARVSVEYAGFRHVYGADWAGRLQLVRMPACVLTNPELALCQGREVVYSANDLESGTLSADVVVDDVDIAIVGAEPFEDGALGGARRFKRLSGQGGSVYGLSAGFSSAMGSFNATPLASSGSWSSGSGMGGFDWSYSVPIPPTGFGSSPPVSFGYSSQAVDGVVSDENTQGGMLGVGWNVGAGGFIERSYKPCVLDGGGINDFCWVTDNATISLNGKSSELVATAATSDAVGAWSEWRLKNDPGWRVLREIRAATSWDNRNEIWYVMSPEGTEYRFGQRFEATTNVQTQAVWFVPVWGNNPGEPCYGTSCNQAWRWNLDRVRDRAGNVMTYLYQPEVNLYGASGDAYTPAQYVRGGVLKEIRYGTREGLEASYRDVVVFNYKNRCFGSDPTCLWPQTTPVANYLDSPTDLRCQVSPCWKLAPGFWSELALDTIETKVLDPGWRIVDRIKPVIEYPDIDGVGGQPAQQWLRKIQRITAPGHPESVVMPAIRFDSFAGLDNRADAVTMNVWRVSQVDDDLGGRTTVSYAQKLVCNNQPPAGSWVWNTQDCYPRWTTNNGSQGWGAFNRYLVASVTSSDKVAGGPSTVVAYNYEGDAAYRYDTSPFTTNKTWSEPHGYTAVTTISGPGSNATYTKTRQQFYRGMHGDSTGAGGTKSFSVTYYDGTVTADDWWFNGRAFTNETYDYATSGLVERTDTTLTPVTTANYGSQLAVRLDVTKATHTSLEVGGFHTTQTRTVFDAYGFPIETWDIGNVWDGVDDTCTYTEYVRGALQLQYWNLGLPVFSVRTAGSPSYPGGFAGYCDETPGNELGYTKWRYDWLAVGANTTGLVTSTSTRALATAPWLETLSAYNAQNKLASVDGPVAGTSDTTSYLYDSFGHRNAVTDATGHRVNQITDPGRGSVLSISDLNNRTVPSVDDGADKVTTYGYDTVGRVTNVLLPGDSSPSGTVSYTLSVDAQSLVNAPPKITKVTKVTAADSVTTVTYLDGLGRTRETQTSGPNGGRIVSASQYDGRSQVIKSFTGRYLDANTPGDGLWTAGAFNSALLASETRTVYDHVGRATETGLFANNIQVVRPTGVGGANVAVKTVTVYNGHWTYVYPATGSATLSHVNALGLLDAVSEYNTSWVGLKDTTYGYDRNRNQIRVTDPKGNVRWTVFNNLGQETSNNDPDSGVTWFGYTPNGVLQTVVTPTVTVTHESDVLGRPTAVKQGAVVLESFKYDATGEAGLVDSASSFVGGAEIKVDTQGYDVRSRPTGVTYTVPSIPGKTDTNGLAGVYTFSGFGYNVADQPTTVTYPAVAAMAAETVVSGYSATGVASSLTGAGSYVSSSELSNDARLTSRVYDTGTNAVTRSYGWDPATGQLASMTATRASVLLQKEEVAYDAVGNVIINRHTRPAATNSSHTECYGFDGRSRLTSAVTRLNTTNPTPDCAGAVTTTGRLPGLSFNAVYSYDEIGNFVTGPAGSYTYPPSGTGSVRPHAVTSAGATTGITYLGDGMMNTRTDSGVTSTYGWTPLGKLNTVIKAGVTTSMVYGPGGDRILLQDATGTRLFLGNLAERHSASSVTTVKRYYTLGATSVGVRTKIGAGTDSVEYLLGDVRGSSALSVVAGAGGAVNQQWYTPYGATRGTTTITATTRGYIGQHKDTTSGLNFLNARYQDPNLGVFISVDPLVSVTREPYSYGGNNPIKYSDPSGLEKGANGEAQAQCRMQGNCRPNMVVNSWDNTADFGDSIWLSAFNKAKGNLAKMPHNGMGGGWPRNVAGPSNEVGSMLPVVGEIIDGLDCLGGSKLSCLAVFIPFVGGKAAKGLLRGPADEIAESGVVYRTGSRTDAALTDPTGVSFRESISSSADRVQVFKAGDKIYAVDTAKLPPGSVVRDGVPDGHVSIRATPDQIRDAIIDDPDLAGLGMKQMDDGSYRLPK